MVLSSHFWRQCPGLSPDCSPTDTQLLLDTLLPSRANETDLISSHTVDRPLMLPPSATRLPAIKPGTSPNISPFLILLCLRLGSLDAGPEREVLLQVVY